jgi:integrase
MCDAMKVLQPSTINRELCVLSAAINYMRRELDWDIPNPVTGRKLRTDDSRDRYLSEAEVDRLARAAKREPNAPHLSDFIALALHTGCRKGELLGLEWDRVDLQGRYFHLGGSDTKTGKRRSIPINQTARQALLSRARFRSTHCPDSPWVFCHANGSQLKDVKRAFATACRRVGIENFRIHDLRHTFAARLVSRGRPLTEVRDLAWTHDHKDDRAVWAPGARKPSLGRELPGRGGGGKVTIWSRRP